MSQTAGRDKNLIASGVWRRTEPAGANAVPSGTEYPLRRSRKDFPPAVLGWIALIIIWPLLEMALDQRLMDAWAAVVVLLTCSLFAIALLLGDPVRRFAGILWAFLLAYFGAAFVVRYGFGLSYFPFVSDEVFNQTALAAMRAFDLSFIVFFPLLRGKWCRNCIAAHGRAVDQIAATPRWRIFGICIVMVALGIIDWTEVAKIGLGVIAESGRRSFSDVLALASDHNVQVVAIPISILALIRACRTDDRLLRAVVTICVGFAWLPSFLAGSRKEVFLICMAFLPIMLTRPVGAMARWLAVGAALIFILVPILFDGQIIMGFQEFILPYYNIVSVHEYSDYLMPTYSFFSGIQLLLPSFLRISDVRVFGSDLSDLMIALGQNVSYGGQPYAEAMAFAGQTPAVMFLVNNSILLGACYVLARINSIYTIMAFPYLALWGRSILWVTLFFILYGGLLLILLAARRSRGGARMARQYPAVGAYTEHPHGDRSRLCPD